MKRIRIISLIVAAVFAVASLYFRSVEVTLSVLAGAAIVIASFELLRVIVSRAFGPAKKSLAVIVIAALMKFTLLGFVIWFVVVRTPANPVAFLAGLSTIVISIVIYGL